MPLCFMFIVINAFNRQKAVILLDVVMQYDAIKNIVFWKNFFLKAIY